MDNGIVDNILYLLAWPNNDSNSSPTVFTAPLDTLSKHQLKWNEIIATPRLASAPVKVYGTHLLITSKTKRYTSDVYKFNKAVGHNWTHSISNCKKFISCSYTADNRVIILLATGIVIIR